MGKQIIASERHQKALDYALDAIRRSPVCPYVEAVYLYGSCARGEETENSDVDLFVQMHPSVSENSGLRRHYLRLRSEVITHDVTDPVTDLKIVVGNEWKSFNLLYFEFIKEEGVLLCL